MLSFGVGARDALRPRPRDGEVHHLHRRDIEGFAATGLRVGWAFGPTDVIGKMNTLLMHMGGWAPRRADGLAQMLDDDDAIAPPRSIQARYRPAHRPFGGFQEAQGRRPWSTASSPPRHLRERARSSLWEEGGERRRDPDQRGRPQVLEARRAWAWCLPGVRCARRTGLDDSQRGCVVSGDRSSASSPWRRSGRCLGRIKGSRWRSARALLVYHSPLPVPGDRVPAFGHQRYNAEES